ncbi:AAA family ATPase [Pseudopedobacter beijingensis]|uniref:AAA family ATPase n=1 Tax=Pseudopedobacter beijingensis TaxID=1207056 RepID=A0ABW4IE69_9SPHI
MDTNDIIINNNFYILTGGPGSGKTTLLKELEKRGYETVGEAGRDIMQDQIATNGIALPWKNNQQYSKLMLEKSVKDYLEKADTETRNLVFFDRGILDTVGYMELTNQQVTEKADALARKYNYNTKVFVFPPWKEIYENDEERKQSWEEAVATYNQIKKTYTEYGYETIDVPKDSLANRADFLMKIIRLFG